MRSSGSLNPADACSSALSATRVRSPWVGAFLADLAVGLVDPDADVIRRTHGVRAVFFSAAAFGGVLARFSPALVAPPPPFFFTTSIRCTMILSPAAPESMSLPVHVMRVDDGVGG